MNLDPFESSSDFDDESETGTSEVDDCIGDESAVPIDAGSVAAEDAETIEVMRDVAGEDAATNKVADVTDSELGVCIVVVSGEVEVIDTEAVTCATLVSIDCTPATDDVDAETSKVVGEVAETAGSEVSTVLVARAVEILRSLGSVVVVVMAPVRIVATATVTTGLVARVVEILRSLGSVVVVVKAPVSIVATGTTVAVV